jgi:hypothetical protein
MRFNLGLLVAERFASKGPQFPAFWHEDLDEVALRLDGRALFDNQQGHQALGKDEQHGQQGKKGPLFFRNRY